MKITMTLLLSCLLGFNSIAAGTGRTWTVLGETSGEFKQKAVDHGANRPDPPVTIKFNVPGPGVLRVTCWQRPYYSGISPETGVMDMTRTGDTSMLCYGLFSLLDPKVPQNGAPFMTCSAGKVMKAQPAFVEFRAPVNYSYNTQLGCAVRLKVEFSSGLPTAGENFAPTGVSATSAATTTTNTSKTVKPGPFAKRTSYKVGAIENGKKIGAAQVPWVFDPNGTFEAPGLWKGTWTRQSDGSLKAVMSNNGVTDELVIRFDGNSFTATKNGKPYRWGSLVP
jgi:hypothetical protein